MKVNTDSDLSILLKDRYNVNNPIWVLFLSNEAIFDEFLNLSFNCVYDIRSEPSTGLASDLMLR